MNISALDENGKPIDWWFAYKVPKLTKDANTSSATGYEYVYYDTEAVPGEAFGGSQPRSLAVATAVRHE